MVELLLWPFVAGLVLTAIHAYFGLHVLARGVIFVDLSLAQVAALGLTIALLAGHPVQSEAAYWYALGFALLGAVLFALARPYEKALPQEAVIGIVYAVSASLAVIVLDRTPQGAEHIKQLVIGSILTVAPAEVGHIALLYAAIGAVHLAFRRPLVAASFGPPAAKVFVWDVVFYASFALVVTSSVRIAGVLLVFSYLIVPAALAGLLAACLAQRLVLAWVLGGGITAIGLYASWIWDLPTGPAIVSAFGLATALVVLAFVVRRLSLRRAGFGFVVLISLAGLWLSAFPHESQPWLEALEDAVPVVHTVFLEPRERATRTEALESIARDRAELIRLRALEQDVRWGKVEMDAERVERLRQYLAGRDEISAGDALTLRHLRAKARERQRFALGLPLLIGGGVALYALTRRATGPSLGGGKAGTWRSRP